MNTSRDLVQRLISAAQTEKETRTPSKNEPVVSITTHTSRASFIYERMRNAVDYQEEHLVRRNAVVRILRRLITTTGRNNLAELLVHELIHARYLQNDGIPRKKLATLDHIIEKYFRLFGHVPILEISSRKSMPGWMLGIMATEIDEFLMPPYVMHASINAMYESMRERVHIEELLTEEDHYKQLYLAASRTLYKNDDETLKYHLFIMYYPQWREADDELLRHIGAHLLNIRAQISADLEHPVREKLNTVMRKHVAYFIILREIVMNNPEGAAMLLRNEGELTQTIYAACNEHYARARQRLRRSIWRSVVYLLLTKFLLAIVLEIPVEYMLLDEFHPIPLAINVIFPPVLLITIAASSKIPGDDNTAQITEGIRQIINGNGEMIQIPQHHARSMMTNLLFALSYGLLFIVSFGVLVSILQGLGFTFVSIIIFLFFITLVSLFAYRIRRATQELIVIPPRKTLGKSLFSFFAIPVLHAGKWMSQRFSKINIFIFILDFVIEAPFKSFMKVTEDWMNYVQEKKDEI